MEDSSDDSTPLINMRKPIGQPKPHKRVSIIKHKVKNPASPPPPPRPMKKKASIIKVNKKPEQKSSTTIVYDDFTEDEEADDGQTVIDSYTTGESDDDSINFVATRHNSKGSFNSFIQIDQTKKINSVLKNVAESIKSFKIGKFQSDMKSYEKKYLRHIERRRQSKPKHLKVETTPEGIRDLNLLLHIFTPLILLFIPLTGFIFVIRSFQRIPTLVNMSLKGEDISSEYFSLMFHVFNLLFFFTQENTLQIISTALIILSQVQIISESWKLLYTPKRDKNLVLQSFSAFGFVARNIVSGSLFLCFYFTLDYLRVWPQYNLRAPLGVERLEGYLLSSLVSILELIFINPFEIQSLKIFWIFGKSISIILNISTAQSLNESLAESEKILQQAYALNKDESFEFGPMM
eukprot:snap_masked-scaffold_14-processed-gene-11.33-mRNA-1 protein AED:1.00 eAED:1.00 QI:0/0/0/0/1/1/2/0/404